MMRYLIGLAVVLAAMTQAMTGSPAFAAQEPSACPSALWLEARTVVATPEPAQTSVEPTAPAWMTVALTDACTGQSFALADFAGKVLYIEPMATWCTNCHGQMTRLNEALSRIPEDARGDIVLVALSSEIGLPTEDLAAYAARNEFPYIFAVMTEEMLRAMAEDLGQEVAVPPAMPHLVVSPDGSIGELRTGAASPDDLLALLTEPALPPAS